MWCWITRLRRVAHEPPPPIRLRHPRRRPVHALPLGWASHVVVLMKHSQSVLDALADYETFVNYHREDLLGPINYALLAAMIGGAYAINPPEDDPEPEPEYRYARAAARAAFQVCPALRGDP